MSARRAFGFSKGFLDVARNDTIAAADIQVGRRRYEVGGGDFDV